MLAALWVGFIILLALLLLGGQGGGVDRLVAALVLLAAAGNGLVPATYSFRRRKRRQRAATRVDDLARDRRPPVVYLRPFGDDGSAPPISALFYALFQPLAVRLPRLPTYEEILATQLDYLGPLVALARPRESLPELGATRIKAPEAAWRDTVEALLGRCRLVLFRAGDTANLLWELRTVVQRVSPEKLIIYLQMGSEEDSGVQRARYNRFRRESAGIFPHPLPEMPGRARRNRFLFFGPAWQPRFAARLSTVLKAKAIPYETPVRSRLKRLAPLARTGDPDGGSAVAGMWLRRRLRWWELATAGLVVAALLGGLYGRISRTVDLPFDVAALSLLTATTGAAVGLIGRIGKRAGSAAYAAVGSLAALAFLYLAGASRVASPGALPVFDPASIWEGSRRLLAESGTGRAPTQLEFWIEAVVAFGLIAATAWVYGLSQLELARIERSDLNGAPSD